MADGVQEALTDVAPYADAFSLAQQGAVRAAGARCKLRQLLQHHEQLEQASQRVLRQLTAEGGRAAEPYQEQPLTAQAGRSAADLPLSPAMTSQREAVLLQPSPAEDNAHHLSSNVELGMDLGDTGNAVPTADEQFQAGTTVPLVGVDLLGVAVAPSQEEVDNLMGSCSGDSSELVPADGELSESDSSLYATDKSYEHIESDSE